MIQFILHLLQLMCELGNGVINQIYEARREELGARKPQPGDPRYRTALLYGLEVCNGNFIH